MTPACFEPTIDYVVTKIPRFTFEKFPEADATLTTQMKSVGEAMAIGRTFKESFQKVPALAWKSAPVVSAATARHGATMSRSRRNSNAKLGDAECRAHVLSSVMRFKAGYTVEQIFDLTKIDPWFLDQLREIIEMEEELRKRDAWRRLYDRAFRRAKQFGFSDRQLAHILQERYATSGPSGRSAGSTRPIGWSIPARRSSRPTRRTTIPPTKTKTKCCRRAARRRS